MGAAQASMPDISTVEPAAPAVQSKRGYYHHDEGSARAGQRVVRLPPPAPASTTSPIPGPGVCVGFPACTLPRRPWALEQPPPVIRPIHNELHQLVPPQTFVPVQATSFG